MGPEVRNEARFLIEVEWSKRDPEFEEGEHESSSFCPVSLRFLPASPSFIAAKAGQGPEVLTMK